LGLWYKEEGGKEGKGREFQDRSKRPDPWGFAQSLW
jgi:hypothetical protein